MQTFYGLLHQMKQAPGYQFTPFQKGKKSFLVLLFSFKKLCPYTLCPYTHCHEILCRPLNHDRNYLLTVFELWISGILLKDLNT